MTTIDITQCTKGRSQKKKREEREREKTLVRKEGYNIKTVMEYIRTRFSSPLWAVNLSIEKKPRAEQSRARQQAPHSKMGKRHLTIGRAEDKKKGGRGGEGREETGKNARKKRDTTHNDRLTERSQTSKWSKWGLVTVWQ